MLRFKVSRFVIHRRHLQIVAWVNFCSNSKTSDQARLVDGREVHFGGALPTFPRWTRLTNEI